jgi:hypothetical protein
MQNQKYYEDKDGKAPYQMYYPGVDGYWPLGRWRRWVWSLFEPWNKLLNNKWRLHPSRYPFPAEEEWAHPIGSCWHLPCAVRVNFGVFMYTRCAVPVTENLSRVIYFHHRRKPRTKLGEWVLTAWFYAYFNYWLHYNFSGQDALVAAPCRFWTKENLSATDSHLVLLRKLITERSRDAKLRRSKLDEDRFESEQMLYERQARSEVAVENSLEVAASIEDRSEEMRTASSRFSR